MEPHERIVFVAASQMTPVAITNFRAQVAVTKLLANGNRRRLQKLYSVVEVPLEHVVSKPAFGFIRQNCEWSYRKGIDFRSKQSQRTKSALRHQIGSEGMSM